MKISVSRKEMDQLRDAFPGVQQNAIYKALRYESHSMKASQIRCFAMNKLKKSILYTSNNY